MVFRKLFFLFIVLSAVFSAEISYPQMLSYNVTFQHESGSWQWYIGFGGEDIINPTMTKESMESIYDGARKGDNYTLSKIDEAKAFSLDAIRSEEVCSEFFVFDEDGNIYPGNLLLGVVGSSLSGLSSDELGSLYGYNDVIGPLFGKTIESYTETTYTYKEVGNETVRVAHTKTKYKLVPYDGSNKIPPEKINKAIEASSRIVSMDSDFLFDIVLFGGISLSLSSINFIDSAYQCRAYGESFKNAWNALGEATSYEVDKANEGLAKMEEIHSELEYLGVCEENYTGPGVDLCNAISEDLGTLSTAGKELKTIEEAMANLSSFLPLYGHFLAIVESEEALSSRVANYSRQYNETLQEINFTIVEDKFFLGQELEDLKRIYDEARAENVQDIRGALLSGAVAEGAKTLEQKYYLLEGDISYIESGLEKIDSLMEIKPRGYVAEAYSLLMEMKSKTYEKEDLTESARDYIEALDSHIASYVESLKSRGYEVSSLENLLKEARGEKTLGKMYVRYVAALNKGKEMESEGPAKKEEYEELLLSVRNLLELAKDDGIDTSYEEESLNYIENKEASYIEKFNDIENLKEDILSKARQRFSGIYSLKSELEGLLSAGDFGDLENRKKTLEGQVFSGSTIDFERGLGKLLELEEFYKETIQQIQEDMEKKASLIKVDVDYDIPLASIDEESTLNVELNAYNQFAYNLQNIEKTMKLIGEFYTDEISVDRGYVISSGNEITWYIPFLNAYESISGKITKKGVFIRSIGEDVRIEGNEGNGVKISNYSLEVEVDSLLDIPCEDCEVFLDGTPKGKRETVELSRGIHTLLLKERVNPYILNEETVECTSLGESTYCIKRIVIEAQEEVGETTIKVPLGAHIESVPENAEVLGNFVKLLNMQPGKNYSIEYSEQNLNEEERLANIISYLEEGNLTGDQETEVSQVKSLNISGFKVQALEKAEKLFEEVKKQREEESDALMEEKKVEEALKNDLEELSEAIAVGSSLSSELEEQKQELAAQGPYDSSWKKKYVSIATKDLWRRFSELKKSYFKNSPPDEKIESIFDRFEEEHRKAKAFYDVVALAEAAKALDDAEKKVDEDIGKESDISKTFDSLKVQLSNKLSEYLELEKASKKYGVEDYLPKTSTYFKSRMKAISSAKDLRQKSLMIEEMEKLGKEIEESIASLKEIAEKEVSEAESLLVSKDVPREAWQESISLAKNAIKEGNLPKAIALAKEIKKNAYRHGVIPQNDLLPFLALAGVGVAALAMMYRERLFRRDNKPKRRKIRKFGE